MTMTGDVIRLMQAVKELKHTVTRLEIRIQALEGRRRARTK